MIASSNAHLVLVNILQRLDRPHRVSHAPACAVVVHEDGADGAGGIDHEEATECGAEHAVGGIGYEDSVVVRDLGEGEERVRGEGGGGEEGRRSERRENLSGPASPSFQCPQ